MKKLLCRAAAIAAMVVAMTACTKPNAGVTDVKLDKNTLTLIVGKTGLLKATVLPEDAADQNVTWKSSVETVATVNAGVVTALAEGSTIITVITSDGGKSAECAVTVEADKPNTDDIPSITFTSAEGAYESRTSSPTADNIVLTFREGSFDAEGNPTGKGWVMIVPCYTKPAADGVYIIASGTYNAAAGGDAFTFMPGNAADGTGARIIKYGDNGQTATTSIDGGSFKVKKTSSVFTFEFRMSYGEKSFESGYTGELHLSGDYQQLDQSGAYFYDDYYGFGSMCWGLDLFRTLDSEAQEGISVNLNMDMAFDFENGRLQEGVYTASTKGTAGTYMQGTMDGKDPKGSVCVLVVDSKKTLNIITGGTLTVKSSGKNYVITTDFEVKNIKDGTMTENVRFQYSGEIEMQNKSGRNRIWNADIRTAQATWYGDPRTSTDKWILMLSWPDGEEMRHYMIEIYAPKISRDDGLVLPTGTFNMAAAADGRQEGTMEPGTGDITHGLNGTWFITTWENAIKVDPRPGKPGMGSITITKNGDKYDIVSHFEDDRNNQFHGTYTAGAVTIFDEGAIDYVIDSWNEHGVIYYNGMSTEYGKLRAHLMNGSMHVDEKGYIRGTGMYVDLDFCVDPAEKRHIPLGLYTKKQFNYQPNTLGGYSAFYIYKEEGVFEGGRAVASGTVDVTACEGDTYTMVLDLGLDDGSTVKGTFTGSLAYTDASMLVSASRAGSASKPASAGNLRSGQGRTHCAASLSGQYKPAYFQLPSSGKGKVYSSEPYRRLRVR